MKEPFASLFARHRPGLELAQWTRQSPRQMRQLQFLIAE